jgi:hypothetical protein
METITCGCTKDSPVCETGKHLENLIYHYGEYAYECIFFSDFPSSLNSEQWLKAVLTYIEHYQEEYIINITPLSDRLNDVYDALVEDDEVFHHGILWHAIQRLGWVALQDKWEDEKRTEEIMEIVNGLCLHPSIESVCMQIILLNALDHDLSSFVFVGIGISAPTEPETKEPEKTDEQPIETKTRTRPAFYDAALPLLDFVDHHLAQVPEESDVVHDLLVFFAEEMLRLNKEKQALEKSFLSYIEKLLCIQPQPDKDGNVGIAAMKNKTQIFNYVGDYQKNEDPLSWRRLSEILTLNKKLCQVDQFDRLLFDIEREYHANLDKVLPIKAQLEKTDWLIDETVYKLYGLTEEEIQIVEDTVARK